MGANISVFPVLQKHRVDKSGRSAINIRIDVNHRAVAYDKMGVKAPKISSEYWDESKRCVRSTHPNASVLNNIIKKRVAELEGIFLHKEQQGLRLNVSTIKKLVAGIDPGQDVYKFCEDQIKEKYDNSETLRTYRSEITKLKQFRPYLSFADVDYKFLQQYAAYMRDKLKNANNTIWKTFKFMNTMMNDAVKIGGMIDKNPFESFDRGKYKQTPRTFITKTERPLMEGLLEKDLPAELLLVTAYYLLMVYCGLRYEDAMTFDYEQHIIDDERLVMETQKKDYQLNFKLYPKLREIMLFIHNNRLDGPWKVQNKAFNAMLKMAVGHAGIDKHLTAHSGRHSFGRLLAEKKVNKENAQKLLGHHDRRSTEVYYHMLDTDLDQEVDDKLGDM